MALHDISRITKSVINLLEDAFKRDSSPISPEDASWPKDDDKDPAIKVFPEPPNRTNAHGVGFYLYHIQENAHYKNMPPIGNDTSSVRYTPMALNLYYQLTANSANDDDSAYDEQHMMSVAMKALHDFPFIDDNTNGGTFLESSIKGRNNRIQISLQPVTYTEAIQFWTAEESPVKLSAYYEVSVVFLEPEPPKTVSGRVLAYGVNVFTEGAPQIISSQSLVTFNIPDEANEHQIIAQPAQVETKRPVPPILPVQAVTRSLVKFLGSGFNGDNLDLLIIHPRWAKDNIGIVPITTPLGSPNWNPLLKGSNELSIDVQEKIKLIPKFNSPISDVLLIPSDVLPGMYTAQIRVKRQIKLPNNTTRDILHVSNQFPFIVIPRIDDSTLSATSGSTIRINGHGFQDALIPESEIQIYVGNKRYTADAASNKGTFNIISLTAFDLTLENGLPKGKIPLRVIIAGAESAPNWITIT